MPLIDTAYLNSFQSHPTDYVGLFTKGFNLANAMPWSPENLRKRALEDYQIQMKQQQFAAEMAEKQRAAQMKEALFPFQLQRVKRLAAGVADTPTPQGGIQSYISALRAATQGAPTQPAPIETLPVETPPAQPLSPTPSFGVDPDAPVF
jgi:hypothetical protein